VDHPRVGHLTCVAARHHRTLARCQRQQGVRICYLVEQAADLGPRELRILGGRVLEHLAPEIAEGAEYRRLLAEERRAEAATRLTLRPRGDGSTDLHARIPAPAAPILLELGYALFLQACFVTSIVHIMLGRKAGWNHVPRPAPPAVSRPLC